MVIHDLLGLIKRRDYETLKQKYTKLEEKNLELLNQIEYEQKQIGHLSSLMDDMKLENQELKRIILTLKKGLPEKVDINSNDSYVVYEKFDLKKGETRIHHSSCSTVKKSN